MMMMLAHCYRYRVCYRFGSPRRTLYFNLEGGKEVGREKGGGSGEGGTHRLIGIIG